MAKRKRLTPANPDYLAPAPGALQPFGSVSAAPVAPVAQVAGDSAARAALEELSQTLTDAREEGRLVLALPLAAVQADYLVRDRIRAEDEEMEALLASIAARGQQVPIEVTRIDETRYGLISGWRRLTALRRLAEDRPGAGFDTVLALLRRPADSAESYLAMVEENEIRVGLSHYERARIAARAVEAAVFPDTQSALRSLYGNASKAKRSKIGSFLGLVEAFDGVLRFPEAIGERLGLRLAQALEGDAGLAGRIAGTLAEAAPADPAAEQACLEAALRPARKAPAPEAPAAPAPRDLEQPRKDVWLRRDAKDQLTLYGPGVTPDLHRRLRDFLARG